MTSESELTRFIVGELDSAETQRIKEELDNPTSFASLWMEDLQRRLENPFDIDFGTLFIDSMDPEVLGSEVSDLVHDEISEKPAGVKRAWLRLQMHNKLGSVGDRLAAAEKGGIAEKDLAKKSIAEILEWAEENNVVDMVWERLIQKSTESLDSGQTATASLLLVKAIETSETISTVELSNNLFFGFALVQLAKISAMAGNYPQAVIQWRDALAVFENCDGGVTSRSGELYYEAARQLAEGNQKEEAEFFVQQAIETFKSLKSEWHPTCSLAIGLQRRLIANEDPEIEKISDVKIEKKSIWQSLRKIAISPAITVLKSQIARHAEENDIASAAEKAELLCNIASDREDFPTCLNTLGQMQFMLGDYENAETTFLQAEKLARSARQLGCQRLAAEMLARVYLEFQDVEKAEDYVSQFKNLVAGTESEASQLERILSLSALASISRYRENDEEAKRNLEEAWSLVNSTDNVPQALGQIVQNNLEQVSGSNESVVFSSELQETIGQAIEFSKAGEKEPQTTIHVPVVLEDQGVRMVDVFLAA